MFTYKNSKSEDFNNPNLSQKIEFSITDNIQKIGIKELTLEKRDFLITWSSGKQNCIEFNINSKSFSLSQNVKLIERRLKDEVKKGKKIEDEIVDNAARDIEDQLIKRREEIFNLNQIKTTSAEEGSNNNNDEFKQKLDNYRKQFELSNNPLLEWQNQVYEKYKILESTINRIYPNVWPIMQFIISVKTILNIDDNKLPF